MTDIPANKISALRPAVFFDRDGTLIDDIGYLDDPAGVAFYPGIPEALGKLQECGYLLIVITNQSGIGRGFFDEETAMTINLSMLNMLRVREVQLDAIYYCPHHPDDGCSCRKPSLLMVQRAFDDLHVNKDLSWVVGDIDKDVLTGINAGLKPILVQTGKSDKGEVPADVQRCDTVVEAVEFILERAWQ